MPHFPNTMLFISQRIMSKGLIYVADAHFIDKIEEKKSWTQVPVSKRLQRPVSSDPINGMYHRALLTACIIGPY